MKSVQLFSRLITGSCLVLSLCSSAYAASDEEIADFRNTMAQYNSLFEQGKFKESLVMANKAVDIGKKLYGENSKSFTALNHNLGRNLMRLKDYPQALRALQVTQRLYSKNYERNAQEWIDLYMDLSEAQRKADYKSEWFKYDSNALGVAKTVFGEKSAEYAMMLIDVGHVEIVNQAEDGEQRILDGFETLQHSFTDHPRWGYANFVRAKLAMAHHRYKDAIPYLDTAIDQTRKSAGRAMDTATLMIALAFRSVALEETGHSDIATESLQEIGRIKEKMGDTSAQPVYTIQPRFPTLAIKEQTGTLLNVDKMNEGTVIVDFDIDAQGFTTNHRVFLKTGPAEYAAAAIEAVKKFRYAPHYQGGQAVPISNARYQMTFVVKE